MTSRVNSVRVMLRFNLNDPRMVRAREILEEGVRQERYKSKSHMIVDALLKTFDPESKAGPPTMEAIRAALREEIQLSRLTASPTSPTPTASSGNNNDAEDDATVMDFVGNLF